MPETAGGVRSEGDPPIARAGTSAGPASNKQTLTCHSMGTPGKERQARRKNEAESPLLSGATGGAVGPSGRGVATRSGNRSSANRPVEHPARLIGSAANGTARGWPQATRA